MEIHRAESLSDGATGSYNAVEACVPDRVSYSGGSALRLLELFTLNQPATE